MPTLRAMLDHHIYAAGIAPPIAAPPPGNAGQPKAKLPQPGGKPMNGKSKANGKSQGSPMAQHISNHMQDPLGATKEGFGNLTQKKLEYDQAREDMQRNLTPVQGVINHLSQIHGIMPGTPSGQTPTPGMTPGQQPGQIDPATGLPMDPAMAGQDPNNPGQNDDPDMDPATGNPANMGQTVGKMNQNRPSMAGHQPGVSPGPSENVRPGKMGMPQPGGGMPQNNKQAAKPKGAGSLPGAKGPGDPKVGNKNKKAQEGSSRAIKINVAASSSSGLPVIRASRTIESQFGLVQLGSMTVQAGGPGSGRHALGLQRDHIAKMKQKGYKLVSKGKAPNGTIYHEMKSPSGAIKGYRVFQEGTPGFPNYRARVGSMYSAGTSSGAKKHWSVRNKGPLSTKEKQAHYKTMESMMMQRPGGAGTGHMAPSSMGNNTGGVRSPRGGPVMSGPRMFAKKKIKAGPAQLSDKVDDPGAELSYNPTGGTPKLNAGKVDLCPKCGKIHAHCAGCKGMN